jgi:soluble lytic murein transglycosylase-like protein
MTKRLRAALLGLVFVGTLGLAACDPGGSGAVAPSPSQDAINIAFGPLASQATRVAQCESGLNPAAVSSGGGNWGLFQINRVHAGQFQAVTGQPWSAVTDPYANARYAAWLYNQSGGWGPWTCRWAA